MAAADLGGTERDINYPVVGSHPLVVLELCNKFARSRALREQRTPSKQVMNYGERLVIAVLGSTWIVSRRSDLCDN